MVTLDTLLLSAAVPVAKGAAAATAETISAASSGFASILRGSQSAAAGDSPPANLDSKSLIAEFRSWLRSNGIHGELNLDVTVQAGDQLGFSGENAEKIADLVGGNPEWQNQLKRLAHQITAALGQTNSGTTRINLTDSGWAIGLD